MPVLLISYDLNKHERPASYADVRKVIEDEAVSFKRPLFSQWLVETSEAVGVWVDTVRAVMDEDDRLLVCEIFKPYYYGFAAKDIWPWLDSRVRVLS